MIAGGFAAGMTAALLVAGWRLYQGRTLERNTGPAGLEDTAVSAGFGVMAAKPPMRLLRRIAISRALSLQARGKGADLGCGAGQLVLEMARNAPALHMTGIDLSNALLDQAYRSAMESGFAYRVDFRTGDAGRTPFENHSLDLVVSTLSLHHWECPVEVLDEIARILRPGGSFVIFDLRRDMVAPAWLLVWFATRYIVPPALRQIQEPMGSRNAAYTPDEAAALAQQSQLTGWHIARGTFWLAIEGVRLPARTIKAHAPSA